MQTMVGTILQRLRESKEEQAIQLQLKRLRTGEKNLKRLATRSNHKADFNCGLMLKEKDLAFKYSPPVSWIHITIGESFARELTSFKGVGC